MATAEAAMATVGAPPTDPQLQGLWTAALQSWFSRATVEAAPPWLGDFIVSTFGRVGADRLPPYLGAFVSTTNAALRTVDPVLVNFTALDRQVREQQGRIDQLRDDCDKALAEARTSLQDLIYDLTTEVREATCGARNSWQSKKPKFDTRQLRTEAYSGDRSSWRDFSWASAGSLQSYDQR